MFATPCAGCKLGVGWRLGFALGLLGLQAAQDRARAFKRTAERCHSQINELQAHVNSLFQGVTTNRQACGPVSSPNFPIRSERRVDSCERHLV